MIKVIFVEADNKMRVLHKNAPFLDVSEPLTRDCNKFDLTCSFHMLRRSCLQAKIISFGYKNKVQIANFVLYAIMRTRKLTYHLPDCSRNESLHF